MADQNSSPLVSVILPTRNRAQLLPRAIRSVLGQTYSSLELIIVDDASSDATPQTLQSVKDPRVRCVRNEINRGPGGARNTGIQEAKGELISFLDDDDEYAPDKLRRQVQAMGESLASVGFVYSAVRTVRDGVPIDFFPEFEESGNLFLPFLAGFPIPISASLIRKQHVHPFDEKLSCLEDIDFHLKILKEVKALFVPALCATCYLDRGRKRLSEDLIALHHSFRVLESRYFNDVKDVFLVDAHARALLMFAFRLLSLGYQDEATRGYIDRAFRVKKNRRTLFFKVLNGVAPGILPKFKPHLS